LDENGVIYVGNDSGTLFAIRPDGTVKWRVETGAPVTSPAIGSDRTVYVASGEWLRAFAADGSARWAFRTSGSIQSSPGLAEDGTVYIGSDDGYLYALGADGSLKWLRDGWTSSYAPAIGRDGTIYLSCQDDTVRAVNPDGTVRWSHSPGTDLSSPPSVGTDGTVYFAAGIPGVCGSHLHAVATDGTWLWRYGVPHDNVSDSPVIGVDGTIYYGTWRCDDGGLGTVNALRTDGTLKWSIATEDMLPSFALGSDSVIYAPAWSDVFYAISTDGTVRWQIPNPGGSEFGPVIGRGTAYLVNWYGYLRAVSIAGEPAGASWPMFMHDAQRTCRAR
jgi:outer membrane protein assembly factor BamB